MYRKKSQVTTRLLEYTYALKRKADTKSFSISQMCSLFGETHMFVVQCTSDSEGLCMSSSARLSSETHDVDETKKLLWIC